MHAFSIVRARKNGKVQRLGVMPVGNDKRNSDCSQAVRVLNSRTIPKESKYARLGLK